MMPVIVGVGRSGTTLLRVMLDAHSVLSIPPETGFLPVLAELHDRGGAGPQEFLDALEAVPNLRDLQIPRPDLHAAVTSVEPFGVRAATRRVYALYAERHGKPRWGDKTPMYLLKMDAIERLLPETRFIHMIRDGRDMALSMRPMWFSPGRDFATIALDWVYSITTGRSLSVTLANYMECRYEQLVLEPEATLRRVCAFIDLPFEPAMLDYHRGAAARLGEVKDFHGADGELIISKQQRLANQRLTSMPPQVSRVGRWRSEMTADELREFEAVAGDLLDELGYERASRPSPRDPGPGPGRRARMRVLRFRPLRRLRRGRRRR